MPGMISQYQVVTVSKIPASPDPPAAQKMAATVAILKMNRVHKNPRTETPSKLSSFASLSAVRTSDAGKRSTIERQGRDMANSGSFHGCRCRIGPSGLAIRGFLTAGPGEEN